MSVTFEATATWGGKPLDKLAELMRHRMKFMRENAYDAAVATMINILTSLRAQTRKATSSSTRKLRPSIVHLPAYRVSFDQRTRHRCLRRLPKGSPVETPPYRVKFICGDWRTWAAARVFLVTPEHKRDQPYILAAMSEKDALDFERKRAGHAIDKSGGLAKLAFAIASNRISTRQTAAEKVAAFAEAAARKTVRTSSRLNGQTFEIEVVDSLEHAIPALKSGVLSIDDAYKSAANKTWGLISQYIDKYGTAIIDDARNLGPSPFPEVNRRRSAA